MEREDPVLIETTQFSERDYLTAGHPEHRAKVFREIDIGDQAEVLAVRLLGSRREVDAHEIVEDQGLRRLRESRAADG